MANVKSALDKMDSVFSNWYLEDPMLTMAWCIVEKVPDKNIKTIGIDSRSLPPQIRFNPNFITTLSYEVLEMIMASESFKLLLRHATNRLQNPKDVCALSSQITIDEIMKKNAEKIPELKKVLISAKDFNLPENSYLEDYHRRLRDDEKNMNKQIEKMFGQPKDENDEGEKDEDGYSKFGGQGDAIKEYLDPRNGDNQNWGENSNLDGEIKYLVDNYKGSAKSWGKFSGDAISSIVAANTPKISAREWLRRFNTSITSTAQFLTRMKPNRRFDLEAQGKKRKYITKVLFAIDSSGSMSDQDLAEGFAVVNSAVRHAEIHYLLWDTEIKYIEKKFKKAKTEFKVHGRGGTNPELVLKYAEENSYDGVVIFSDMEFSDNLRAPRNTKVLWLGTDKNSKKPVSFGYWATLDRR